MIASVPELCLLLTFTISNLGVRRSKLHGHVSTMINVDGHVWLLYSHYLPNKYNFSNINQSRRLSSCPVV